MGNALATEVLVFNHTLNASEALRCGLIGDVFPKEQFSSIVEERLKEYLDNPTKCLLYGKELIRGRERELLLKVNDVEIHRNVERQTSEDFALQMRKFAERRRKL